VLMLIGALIAAAVSLSPCGDVFANPDEPDAPAHDDGDPWNGYWWREEIWVPAMPTLESWFTPAPVWSWGKAVFYAPGSMRATAKYRGLSLDGYEGGVAMMSPADIGQEVWMRRPGHGWEGPFLVVDCARWNDIYPIVAHRREVIEVDFDTAVRWGMAKRVGNGWKALRWMTRGVQVSKVHPIALPDVDQPYGGASPGLVYYPQYWLDRVEFATMFHSRPIYRAPNEWYIDGEWRTFDDEEGLGLLSIKRRLPEVFIQ